MPKVRDLIKWLNDYYEPDEDIAWSLWNSADIWLLGDEQDVDLTEEEIEKVLSQANNKMDASIGLNWDTLGHYVSEVIRERNVNEVKKTETRGSTSEDSGENELLG